MTSEELIIRQLLEQRNTAEAKLGEIAKVVEWRNCELSTRIREILKEHE